MQQQQQQQHSSHLTRQETPKLYEGFARARPFPVQLSSPVWLAQPTQGGMAPGAAKTCTHGAWGNVSSEACWRRTEATPLLPIRQRCSP